MSEGRKTFLGIELGSTRIKSVLIGEDFRPIASGSFEWENRFESGVWTYSLDDVWTGLGASFAALAAEADARDGGALSSIKAIGISAMMHGYLAFGNDGGLLAPFRTWRNTITEQAAAELTAEFGFNIPQRWSVAHLYQAILNKEPHVADIAFLTTLAGYVHWKLTGEKVIGVGDASGMFPIDSATKDYDARFMEQFDGLAGGLGFGQGLAGILPKALNAGEGAGFLTGEGAKLLDPSGRLAAGIPLCPPEGDAGTGMVATNSVAERTGNISAGTSVFAMAVLEKGLSKIYPEIDMVTTPSGSPVAMVHCNNCTTDFDAWVKLFGEFGELMGAGYDKTALYNALYSSALNGDPDCGGLLTYNYFSGEHITGFEAGRPLFVKSPESRFTLANFTRALLFSSVATLRIGMDILTERESVHLDRMLGHGGLFKTEGVGQRIMAAALNAPVAVMESAGEGGAWGIALLAAYLLRSDSGEPGEPLEAFLAQRVFAGDAGSRVEPDPADVQGFNAFMERYRAGLPVERAAVNCL